MQSLNQRVTNSFNAGLITEFSELKFPENASVDELNCVLNRDGSRTRRRGLTLEVNAVDSTFDGKPAKVFTTGTWLNAGGVNGYDLVVMQVGKDLKFYVANQAPYSDQELPYSVNLRDYEVAGFTASKEKCQFTSLSGMLVVASPAIDTIVVELDHDASTISSSVINFKVRDFDHQSDVSVNSDAIPLASVSLARKYDTLNSGWTGKYGQSALDTYTSARTAYPPLTHSWYSGKDSSGDFDLDEWEKIYAGTSVLGNGHFILDFFNKDRADAASIPGLPMEVESNRFRTVAAYAGRVWYAGLGGGKNAGRILYSKTVETPSAAILGDCYQQNDPTSEDFSDLLDTDGGAISIPDATQIKKIFAAEQFLYIFAENGVWIIGGVGSQNANTARYVSRNFSSSSYFVSKVSSVGIDSVESFASVEGVPFWWSKFGIHTLSFDQSTGMPIEQNITLSTIQTFWNNISVEAKKSCSSCYDSRNKKIYWLYKSPTDTVKNKFSNVLVLDITLKAFYPWAIGSSSDYVMGLYSMEGFGLNLARVPVVDSDETEVVVNDEAVVSGDTSQTGTSDTVVIAWIFNNATDKVTVGTFTSKDYKDFTNVDYNSYAVAGYDFLGDPERRKTAPYITVFCRSTEEGFTGSDELGYTPINASSLYVSALWDFKDSSFSRQQAYRVKPFALVDETDLDNTQQNKSVVATRLKLRGKGRSVRLKFESESGKDFNILGYAMVVGVNNGF